MIICIIIMFKTLLIVIMIFKIVMRAIYGGINIDYTKLS